MKKTILSILLTLICAVGFAQRFTDNLDRGLVAVKTSSGVFLSWRILAEEYYDVTYNVYHDGNKLNDTPLVASNYVHSGANGDGTYTIKAVVKGIEQTTSSAAVSTWDINQGAGYIDIQLADVLDRNGNNVTSHYSPNDAEMADLDGDGQMEIIIKRINDADASGSEIYKYDSKEFTILDAYDVNWKTGEATRMWWIDCGPNMVSMNSVEINIFAYDWDEDGKAEVVLRGADDMIVHYNNGNSCTIGVAGANYRNDLVSHANAQYAWTHTGPEYLVYMNGESGEVWQQMEFPLKRFESDEAGKTEQQVWSPNNSNGGYGHRSSKYFFGAPFLDGRNASLFLARGIYTQTKMWSGDLNKSTHQWSQRWTWRNNTVGSSWFGQGNHNFTIADVDLDGRDEIVYGSMTIDDNGQGLSTTGLGHGDALHVGKFNPYRKGGLEMFACNEDNPGSNYRDATTSQIFFRQVADKDDGRALMGNFSNTIPGSLGRSISSSMISSVTNNVVPTISDNYIAWGDLNSRIYWDGDLCDEILNSPGTAKEAKVEKPGTGRLFVSEGCNMNNDSKNNPCFQGDVIGDWREEILLRHGTNLRLYTTITPTKYGIYTLWHDHQYRQAMVWQMCGYNQPPHKSYFLGEIEGFTIAPPPLTNRNREELSNGTIVGTEKDGKHLMYIAKSNSDVIKYSGKIDPSVLTINVPVIVSGNGDNNNITSTAYRCSLINNDGNSGIVGDARLVKQGEGMLIMAKKTLGYSGNTDIWGGSVQFNGTLTNSMVNMHPHTELYTSGTFSKGITMEYGSKLYISDKNYASTDIQSVTISDLTLKEGACIEFDFSTTETNCDMLNLNNLTVVKKTWEYGPEYNAPVFRLKNATNLADGIYKIGTVSKDVIGNTADIIVEGVTTAISGSPVAINRNENNLYLVVGELVSEVAENVAFKLDFEETSSNNYGFNIGNNTTCKQETFDNTVSHYFHLFNGTSYNSTSTISLNSSSADYVLEFDFAAVSQGASNSNISTINFIGSNSNTLLRAQFYGYGNNVEILSNNGNNPIGEIGCQAYYKDHSNTISYNPSNWYRFIIEGYHDDGVYLTVNNINGSNKISRIKISSEFSSINNIELNLSKYYAHIALDDITLTQYSTTLSDKKLMPEAGTYAGLTLDRRLVAGYNTLCLPYAATLTEVAGENSKAYTLEGGNVATVSGTTTLSLVEVTGTLEANKPYVVWCPKAVSLPNVNTATTVNPVAGSVSSAGWTVQGNYTPHFGTEGYYVIYNNELRKCGSTAYVDGMRAYFIAPSISNNAPIRLVFGDDATSINSVSAQGSAEAIYGVDGKQRSSIQRGINIIRMSDGTVKKQVCK